ncbi:hypothetical protein [Streptomyces sp. NPDC002611]
MEYLVDISSWRETLRGEHPNTKMEKKLSDMANSLSALTKAYQGANGSAIRAERQASVDRLRRELGGDDSAS